MTSGAKRAMALSVRRFPWPRDKESVLMSTAATAYNGIPPGIAHIIDRYDRPGGRVLEIGSSAGLHTGGLRAGVTVLDLDPDKLRASGRCGNVTALVRHDLTALPLPVEGPFDLILCLEVLEHLEWPAAVALLDQLEGLCGGALVLSTPQVTNLTQFLRFLITRQVLFDGSYTLVERLLYRLQKGEWYDREGELARLRAIEKEHPDLGRHKCCVPTRFLRRRGYAVTGGMSVFLQQYPFFRRFNAACGLLLALCPFLSGTTWAYRIPSAR